MSSTLPKEVKSHHTIWLDLPGGGTAAVRYAMDGDRVVCFGDDGLGAVPDGTRLSAGLRALACGPPDVADFWVNMKELGPDDVSVAVLSDVVGHGALGRSTEEVLRKLESMRQSRRLVALEG